MDPINTQNSSGMMNGMPPAPQTEKKVGPIVGVLIIVLVLIVAALYFFGQKLNTDTPARDNTQAMQSTSPLPSETMTASAAQADDTAALEAELEAQLKDVDYSF